MDHRQRILAAIRHQPVDRVPSDMWATPEVLRKLYAHYGITDGEGALFRLWDRMDIDGIADIAPAYNGPPIAQSGDVRMDEWGRGWRNQPYEMGVYEEQVIYPLAQAETVEDLERYPWPDPDWYDYAGLPAQAAARAGRAIGLGYTAPFYYHMMLRGQEQALMDPVLRPDFTHHLLARLSDFFTAYHRCCFEAAGRLADITQVTDDFGSQHGLMISPRIFERFYRPALERAIDLAQSYGLLVFHHDDGDCRPILPALIEMGIDILNPIQWRCGDWDLAGLKARYGDRLCFHSAVDNQQTLPHGTPDDVRAEVHRLIATLACDGTGFIIAPCHNLQAVTPVENIVALYETAHAHRLR